MSYEQKDPRQFEVRVNRRIRVPEVRVINGDGEQLGILPTFEALKLAQEAGVDLVEVQPKAQPPVCRIMDYGKYKYLQAKREKDNRNPSKGLKEVIVHPKTTEHDLSYRVPQIKEWLAEGHKVQVACLFKGREIVHQTIGKAHLEYLTEQTKDVARVESPIRMEGKRMAMLLGAK